MAICLFIDFLLTQINFYRLIKDKPSDYIKFIHEDCLSKICQESGFQGLAYYGGPEKKCDECKESSVLHCVEYGTNEDIDLTPSCKSCGTKYDIDNLLVNN